MAGFRKDRTTAAQTAANVAGNVTSALIAQGSIQDVQGAANSVAGLFDVLFQRLGPVVDADNEVFAAAEATMSPGPSSSGGRRERKTSGGGRSNGKVTLESALEMKLKGGAFEGETLADVLTIDAAEAEREYGYGDGEKSGREWIAWAASELNKNDYTRERAALVAADAGITPLEVKARS